MLKILHTSDVHIGVRFGAFGKKAEEQRKALLNTFAAIADRAVASQTHLLLIAGDLFDSNFPSYDSVNFVKAQFKKLEEARVFTAIVPGTHDCLSKDSIYRREHFAVQFPHIYVFDDETATAKEFPEIDTTVFAKANTSNKSTGSPVAFMESGVQKAKTTHKVGMAHGSVQIEGKSAGDDMPITLKEIARSGVQYLALGHWHGAQEFSFGATKAWYAGSPEITYQEGKGGLGQGYALEVTVSDTVDVKPVKMSTKEVKEVRMDMQVYENMENVYYELEKLANPNLILMVTLFGVAPSTLLVDTERIEADFSDKFFTIKAADETTARPEEITDRDYPKELVIGQFARMMRAKLDAAKTEDEKKIVMDALHLGIAELEGKSVLE